MTQRTESTPPVTLIFSRYGAQVRVLYGKVLLTFNGPKQAIRSRVHRRATGVALTTRFLNGAGFMTMPSPDLHQADRLTEEQVAQFKRDGLLVLPGVLDPDLCRQARDQMWAVLAEHRPTMQRDDPSTWGRSATTRPTATNDQI